ncbi:hypothetical protein L345_17772, partial [Ophiophagus hannah]
LKNELQKKEGEKVAEINEGKEQEKSDNQEAPAVKKPRGDLSNLKNLRQGQLKNQQMKSSLAARYDLENMEIALGIEELKQRVVAIAEKIKRYENQSSFN